MIDYGKKNILGIYVDAVDYEAVVNKIITAAKARQGFGVSALAVHGIMTGVLDRDHRYRLNHLDLITPDGQPVRWAINWLYNLHITDRVYGPTLMLSICTRAQEESLPIYLYGSQPSTLQKLRTNLKARFPELVIAGTSPSMFRRISAEEKQAIIQKICSSQAAITFVGLGCPRQEVWVYEFREAVHMPLIAVGAAFDFHAGTLSQAPNVYQKWGLEWFYRFWKEPKRLWKRYLLMNPLYLWFLSLQKASLMKFDPGDVTPPEEELRYG